MGSRWYNRPGQGTQVPMQRGHGRSGLISEDIARLAYEEYTNQGHGQGQTFEQLHQRGGFSEMEIIALLADLLERRG